MFQNSTKKSFLIFYLLVFLITSFLVLGAKSAMAADEVSSACPEKCTPVGGAPSPVTSGGNRYIRLQIYLPISDFVHTCTYKVKTMQNGQAGDIDKPCHYVASNLPLFIKKAYSFSIGLIAIMAVIIIMIGGVKWILAAGNPGSITDAKNSITAAVSGLVLALLSYAILYTINPNLTNLQLTTPSSIQTIQQSSNWCTATNLIRPKLAANVQGVPEDFKQWSGECGIEYEIKDTKDAFGNNLKICWGNGGCTGKTICYQYVAGTKPFCYEIEEFCTNQDDQEGETGVVKEGSVYLKPTRTSGCDKVDKIFQEYNMSWVCAKYTVTVGKDSCKIGEELFCPQGYERVDCEKSDECSSQRTGYVAADACNYISGYVSGGGWHICTNAPNRGAKGVNGICCKKKGVEEYKCEDDNTTKYNN